MSKLTREQIEDLRKLRMVFSNTTNRERFDDICNMALSSLSAPPASEMPSELIDELLDETLCVKVINVESGNYWRCPICCGHDKHEPQCIITRVAAYATDRDRELRGVRELFKNATGYSVDEYIVMRKEVRDAP